MYNDIGFVYFQHFVLKEDITSLVKAIVKYNECTYPTEEYNSHIEERRKKTHDMWIEYYDSLR